MATQPVGRYNEQAVTDTSQAGAQSPITESRQVSNIPEITNAWNDYIGHLNQYFYNPDTEAVEIVLSVLASHFHKDCDPIWLFVNGPSGGDKSSVCINSILDIPNVHMQGIVTAKTFLSGYTGTANASLLHQIGSGVLAFKDFTTFLSQSKEEQAQIQSQLREIYDGSFVKVTGKGLPLKWKGKITVIAAVTPALEREWGTRRDLGERFIQIRISRKSGISQSEFAQRQRGLETFISDRMKQLATKFFQMTPLITNPPPKLSTNQMTRVAAMAELVSHCRGHVPVNPLTGAITGIAEIENSGRMAKCIAGIISNHAALFRRTEITEIDMEIGKRVALNSIPSNRALIIDIIPLDGFLTTSQLVAQVGLPKSTITFLTDHLEALGVLRIQRNEQIDNNYALTGLAKGLWNKAFSPLAEIANPSGGMLGTGPH
jgi:hypothetical protein